MELLMIGLKEAVQNAHFSILSMMLLAKSRRLVLLHPKVDGFISH
jgi:hypothetical protein